MDNRTEDVTPEYSYVVDSTIQTKKNPCYELGKIEDIPQSKKNKTKRNDFKRALGTTNIFMVFIIMMVILLLVINIILITLSVATYSRSSSEQSRMQDQLEKTNKDVTSVLMKLDTNMSNNGITDHGNIPWILNQLDAKVEQYISLQTQYTSTWTQMHCGPGLWHQLIFLNMSDPTQQCPSAWREYNMNGVRACGRPDNSSGSCSAIRHFTSQQYNRVCGRVIGYQFRSTDAFSHFGDPQINFDGINITIGAQRDHIWSYVAGGSDNSQSECPCSTDSTSSPPQSIGDRYHCESGNSVGTLSDDPLWDGQQCVGTCFTGANSPPWFSVQLSAPTTDMIELSICCDQSTDDEDVPVELIEIFVQ